MRIAVLSLHGCPLGEMDGLYMGGMQLYIRHLTLELDRLGVEMDIFTRHHHPDLPAIEPIGEHSRVIHLEVGGQGPVLKENLYNLIPDYLHQITTFGRGQSYDLIHSHYWLSAHAGERLKRRWGLPHVTMFHSLGKIKRWVGGQEAELDLRIATEMEIMDQADLIIAPTMQERWLMQHSYQAPLGRIAVLPCGVDLGHFQPGDQAQARRELGLPPGQHLLTVAGRLDSVKRADFLLQALALVQGPKDLHLTVIGGIPGSPEVKKLQRLTRSLGLAEAVSFLGPVPPEQLPRYYQAADLCVVPSRYESFGMVTLEALACGIPVVATRAGGLMTTVQHGQNGYLFPGRSPHSLARAIEGILGSDSRHRRFRQQARASAAPYAWDIIAHQMRDTYDRLLQTRRWD
ncbi:MAG: glycosyltransferase [Chloroflexi bacterium]|nr:glycosyltransferase [Chloroflexota bacterium]